MLPIDNSARARQRRVAARRWPGRPPRWHLALLVAGLVPLVTACIAVPRPPHIVSQGAPATDAFDGRAIRVLVWNLYKSSLDGWREDFDALVAERDLLLLQEGYWDAETRGWFTHPGFAWWLGVTFETTRCSPHPATGTLLGSRALPVSPVLSLHSPYREALTGTPKSLIAATFAVTGAARPLLAVSVHATNLHVDTTAFERHIDQAFETVHRHRGPAILAGDFNTWSDARLAYLLDLAASLQLTSVFDPGPPREPGDGRMTWAGHYLDHAFVRGLDVRPGARVHYDVSSSDHAPLSFVVAIPDSSGAGPLPSRSSPARADGRS